AVAGLLGGYLTKTTGKFKTLLIIATTSSSLSYMLLALRWNNNISFWESLYIIPGGFGNGLVQSAAFVALTAKIANDDMAMACSSFYMSANIGTVVGLASTNAVLQGTLRYGLNKGLMGYNNSNKIVDEITSNIEFVKHLQGPTKPLC
ncbi:hypothetical protein BKA65DRAFT_403537, partial [Rhexocercosporidium sp. MPI-PUGE-AT-0058]